MLSVLSAAMPPTEWNVLLAGTRTVNRCKKPLAFGRTNGTFQTLFLCENSHARLKYYFRAKTRAFPTCVSRHGFAEGHGQRGAVGKICQSITGNCPKIDNIERAPQNQRSTQLKNHEREQNGHSHFTKSKVQLVQLCLTK